LLFIERLEPGSQQLEDIDTARLVTRIQSGDTDAFATLYTRYFDRVYGYLHVILRNAHESDEVTQEVFTRVLAAVGDYERRDKPFRSWLFAIVRNCALDRVRDQQRTELRAPDEFRDNGDEQVQPVALGALSWISDPEVMMLVERLPLAQRQVLVLRYLLDLPSRDVAEILQRSHADVRILQHRALQFLRQRLEALGRTPEHGRRGGIRMRIYGKQLRVLRTRRFALR
jgi:RNA polymerase sigma-70 factor (ECF subfamily)